MKHKPYAQTNNIQLWNKICKSYEHYAIGKINCTGVLNTIIQYGETFRCRKETIKASTCISDKMKDTIWIHGCVDPKDPQNFYIQRIENIKKIQSPMLCQYRARLILFLHGACPSYPKVSECLGLIYKVVNHSK